VGEIKIPSQPACPSDIASAREADKKGGQVG